MSFHISKKDQKLLDQILPQLDKAKEDVVINTPHPARLAALFRNSSAQEKYKWIKEKFRVTTQEGKVVLKIYEIPMVFEENIVESDLTDLMEIASLIINEKPIAVRLPHAKLTDQEMEKLALVCIAQKYELLKNPLTLKKI